MLMMRDARQMALNEVEVRCMEAADHYATAAQRIDDEDLAQLFVELARERKRQAAELVPQLRALGDLPRAPDKDRETVEEMLSSVKSFFSGDKRATVIDEREQAEVQLADAVTAALQCELPPETQNMLLAMRSSIDAAKKNLEAHRPA